MILKDGAGYMLNTDHLYYLMQVAKYGSITTAAEKMHITQPAVSLAIKKLEEQLNMQLLNRSFKGVYLTDDGKQVVQYAKCIFEYVDKIETMAAERYNNNIMNEVTIYSVPSLYTVLSSVASEYYKKYAQGTFRIYKLTGTDLNTLFENNPKALVMMVSVKNRMFADDLDFVVLDSSKSYVGLRIDSDLLPRDQHSISYKELLHLPLIMMDIDDTISQEFSTALYEELTSYGTPNIKYTVPDMNIAQNYLMNDLGICFFYGFSLINSVDRFDSTIRTVPIKDALEFDIVLLYKKGHEAEYIKGVIDLIDSIR